MHTVPAAAFPTPLNKDHIHKGTHILKGELYLGKKAYVKRREVNRSEEEVSVLDRGALNKGVSVFMIVTV